MGHHSKIWAKTVLEERDMATLFVFFCQVQHYFHCKVTVKMKIQNNSKVHFYQ